MNRIEPSLPADLMRTYALRAPLATHFRPASCEEVDCQMRQHGWRTTIDVDTELGRRQAHYIRVSSGRRFTEAMEAGLLQFTFPPGQQCFAGHRLPLDREPLYLVRDGDWRGDPRGTPARRHAHAEDWIDDMQESLDRTRSRLERG